MFYTKIFLVVLIVDSFSEALLSTSPAWTVPANVQITATQLFFHYRLCKTNYYYHYYYYYYYYHCYYFHYYYHYIHYKTNYYLLLWNCSSRSVLLQISLLSVTVIRQCSAGVSFYAKTKISISDGNIYDPHTPHYLCFRIFFSFCSSWLLLQYTRSAIWPPTSWSFSFAPKFKIVRLIHS